MTRDQAVEGAPLGGHDIDELNRLPPIDRIRAAAVQMERHRRGLAVLAAIRADAVDELVARGATQADIARELGVSAGAIAKLRNRSAATPAGTVTVSEAARRLGLRTTEVLRLVDAGELAASSNDGRILVAIEAVSARASARPRASGRRGAP